jgi:beta-N-acetylglucosaminidase-like protein
MEGHFLAGVIEGFYGQPWSQAERFQLFDWMKNWGLNTYLYAPKDDLKHRAIWREPYTATEQESFRELIRCCKEREIRFIYGLSPGLDIQYDSKPDLEHLKKRLEQMSQLGCQNFALLFDDIPRPLDASLASAQCNVACALQRQGYGHLLFCPTAYCGRHDGDHYLSTIGRELSPGIDVFWTGPEIISREITVAHVRELQTVLRRKPLIWDNLHANDYDGRRFYCGPYAGRPPELRKEVSGLMLNPNTEFPLNYVPLRTFAEFVNCKGVWDPRKAYLGGLREWLLHFATVGEPVVLENLILFGDCYYLPHEEGPEAEALIREGTFGKPARRLRDFCGRMAELRDRRLFYALSRRVWELREELDLLIGFFERKDVRVPYRPGSHLPGTYRGGMVARLQRILKQHSDGTFTL